MFKKRSGQLVKRNKGRGLRVRTNPKRSLPKIYLSETYEDLPETFLQESGNLKSASHLKWLVSTCIAACVGIMAIGMVLYAVMDMEDGSGIINSIQKASLDAMQPVKKATIVNNKLRVASRKTDRLVVTSKGLSTRHIIHDRVAQRRGNRDFIVVKPYTHVVATLSTVRPRKVKKIPAFNPFKVYATTARSFTSSDGKSLKQGRLIRTNMTDLQDSLSLNKDGEKLSLADVRILISETYEIYKENNQAIRPALNENLSNQKTQKTLPPRLTIIDKTVDEDDLPEHHEVRSVFIKPKSSIFKVVGKFAVEKWQTAKISDAITKVVPVSKIRSGQELRFILVPTLEDSQKLEPLSVSLFDGDEHKATVERNSAGDYVASAEITNLTVTKQQVRTDFPKRSTVYTSLYHAALAQSMAPQKINQIIKIHAYDVDFKRRVQLGDQFEVFFDTKKTKKTTHSPYGELLYTSTTISGISRRFYRFRTPNGDVDFYDENGSSAKKFLMRKPVRGARYTSGFGYRLHPILRRRKMHTGVDWSAPRGTPILAAGDAIIEYIGYYGGYGRYIRLRHANGYKTAYAHMHRFAKGLKKGFRVRQGQVIGYVGSSGRSTGNHLHYEVLVNSRHVNPMKIEVPRGRTLKGRLLAEFKKEKTRIDSLMRRAPVKTRVAKIEENI
ncbi:MAG: M23 family metallopeptidase [Pseudomonadota bacterium]